MNFLCRRCPPPLPGDTARLALPNVELCEEHLRKEADEAAATGDALRLDRARMTLDDVRPFSLRAEAARIERIENALHGLDMATALRVLEYVRSRVVGNGGFR